MRTLRIRKGFGDAAISMVLTTVMDMMSNGVFWVLSGSLTTLVCFLKSLPKRSLTGPTQYHLGRGHSSSTSLSEFIEGSVLEIGCGCGAITRALGEFGADVVALEGSSLRAEIAATRCRDLGGVTVVCDSFVLSKQWSVLMS